MSNEIANDFTRETPGADVAPSVTEGASAVDANTVSLGAWFAQARLRCGFEPDQAARHLMLNPAIVRAIEADDFARLGPPVFVRGYLSRYARLLELSEQEALERFRQQTHVVQEPPPLQVVHPLRRQTRTRDLRGLVYLALLIGVGWTAIEHLPDLDPGRLTALWSGESGNSGGATVQNLGDATAQTHYPFQAKTEDAAAPSASAAPPAEPAAVPAAPPASVVFTTTVNPAPILSVSEVQNAAGAAASFAVQTSNATVAGENGEAKLLLEFSNDCWVEIKDAQGNVLASGLMKANTAHALSGPAPFKVTLGNAPAARIILDDRLVDTTIYVPRRGTVSRFTLDRE